MKNTFARGMTSSHAGITQLTRVRSDSARGVTEEDCSTGPLRRKNRRRRRLSWSKTSLELFPPGRPASSPSNW